MSKSTTLLLSAIILILLGAVMIVIGINAGFLPPPITGLGFIIIAIVFLKLRDE